MIHIRQVLFMQAVARPDLIDANFTCNYCPIDPLNPSSDEERDLSKMLKSSDQPHRNKPGFLQQLRPLFIKDRINYNPCDYKYLVVLIGIDAKATSGRLAEFLAHSGAVILLQERSVLSIYNLEMQYLLYILLAALSATTSLPGNLPHLLIKYR